MKKAIIAIITVLVLAIGTCTCLYFFTDVFNFLKPTSETFTVQAKKLFGINEQKYSEYEKNLNKLKIDNSYTSEGELKANLNLPSSTFSKNNQNLINSSNLKYKLSYDASSKKSAGECILQKNNKDILTASAVTDGSSVSINCSDLYDKYLTLDSSKFEEFCKNNNITLSDSNKESLNSLSKLSSNSDASNLMYNLLYISESDYNSLHKTYDNILTDLIDKGNFKTKKNQKISVDGDDVRATAYSLTMSGNDAYDFTTKLLNLISNDSTTKKLLVEKCNLLIKSYGLEKQIPEINDSNIDTFISQIKTSLESEQDTFKDTKKCVKFTIYSKKSNPVKFEVSVLSDEDDKEGSVLFTEELSKGKTVYTINMEELNKLEESSKNSDTDDSNSIMYANSSKYLNATSSKSTTNVLSKFEKLANSLSKIVVTDKYESTKTSRKGTVTISAKASGSSQDLLKIDYDTINSDSEIKENISVSCPLSSSISFDLAYDATGLDSDNRAYDFNMSGKYLIYSLKLTANGTSTIGKSDIPDINSSNSVDVFTLSQTDFQKLVSDIVTKASDTFPSKLSAYGLNVTKEQILSLIPGTTSNTVPMINTTSTSSALENIL